MSAYKQYEDYEQILKVSHIFEGKNSLRKIVSWILKRMKFVEARVSDQISALDQARQVHRATQKFIREYKQELEKFKTNYRDEMNDFIQELEESTARALEARQDEEEEDSQYPLGTLIQFNNLKGVVIPSTSLKPGEVCIAWGNYSWQGYTEEWVTENCKFI